MLSRFPAGLCARCKAVLPAAAGFCPRCGLPAPERKRLDRRAAFRGACGWILTIPGAAMLLLFVFGFGVQSARGRGKLDPGAIVAGIVIFGMMPMAFGILLLLSARRIRRQLRNDYDNWR